MIEEIGGFDEFLNDLGLNEDLDTEEYCATLECLAFVEQSYGTTTDSQKRQGIHSNITNYKVDVWYEDGNFWGIKVLVDIIDYDTTLEVNGNSNGHFQIFDKGKLIRESKIEL